MNRSPFTDRRALCILLIGWCLVCAHSRLAAQTRFTISSDGTQVLDQKTGLTWQRCIEGRVWDSSAGVCVSTGVFSLVSHIQALVLAKSRGGSWRLPNVKELASVYDGAVVTTVFPGSNDDCWSSTTARFNGAAYVVSPDGTVYTYARTLLSCVRLVRSE